MTLKRLVFQRKIIQPRRSQPKKNQVNPFPWELPELTLKGRQDELVHLNDLSNSPLILIFINQSCLHCSNNLEVFLIELKKIRIKPDVALVTGKDNKSYVHELHNKYEGLNIFQGNEQLLNQLGIHFFPAFVVISKEKYIVELTPAPKIAISSLKREFKHVI